jgi:ribonuclease-3
MADAPLPLRDEIVVACARRLGHDFTDPGLLRLALVHRSWGAENDTDTSNERLEFLGDAVLGWAVAEIAYERLSDETEGRLSEIRRAVVNAAALADMARGLDLGSALLLGKGEDAAGGRDKSSILSDAFEAVVGAIHLDGGPEASRAFLRRLFIPAIDAAIPHLHLFDAKTALKEICEQRGSGHPRYEWTATGPDHERVFDVVVLVRGRAVGRGTGTTKKAAEQAAAARAVEVLDAGSGD